MIQPHVSFNERSSVPLILAVIGTDISTLGYSISHVKYKLLLSLVFLVWKYRIEVNILPEAIQFINDRAKV